jgi:sulfur-carrier protein
MNIRILYFASLREALGVSEETFALTTAITGTHSLRAHLASRGEPWATQFAPERAVRAAVNHELHEGDMPIKAGDELAFFPPVTGG